ncbi:Glutathione synthase/RimK-type ligase, ATP-grasp superfamily [Halobacillus karajensis]|uniref:Alpha-L-glutamate ligases, RimK family n=1 Tax=Halobacillus karajensis TaxID=195088 RepID=A0A024P6M3_9BACI|nr:alpha-L-glutamate ligase [Halobacillus karajensis]CDQ20529.1 alpha-L-glutamate ligases, RimK family [Halobacillus karajensis]CDQ24002.1 alpha-L-glutamate ligases, RimK family [Halobacillus karajensis]CDQ27480.1 alpha-L-glutamate ligases, RimK family [Halobacillus karajensis]SEH90317.1 Glutathione synthase/RimK-type ligase, ATP-grasp superfamily [Halobacillus karajensis]
MSKIYILHENDEWTDHLTERLEELNLPYELWHLDQGTLDLTSEPPEGIFYNRISASSHTRNHRYAPEFTEAVLAWLERHGRTVVNGSRALRLEVSKVNQYMALNQAGIRTPKTISAVGKENILEASRQLNMESFITKHNRAGKGQGVQLFHSNEALNQYLNGDSFEEPVDGITLIQQYIEAPEPYIVRHEFVGGKFVYGVKVDTSEGFELCPADACSIDDLYCPTDSKPQTPKAKFEILKDYRPAIIDDYEKFLQENNIQVAGIEAIQDKDGYLYTYDVNTNTNYNSDAEAKAGTYGMLELAKYLGGLLEKSPV